MLLLKIIHINTQKKGFSKKIWLAAVGTEARAAGWAAICKGVFSPRSWNDVVTGSMPSHLDHFSSFLLNLSVSPLDSLQAVL